MKPSAKAKNHPPRCRRATRPQRVQVPIREKSPWRTRIDAALHEGQKSRNPGTSRLNAEPERSACLRSSSAQPTRHRGQSSSVSTVMNSSSAATALWQREQRDCESER